MQRKVLLSGLGVGRCFTLAVEPGARAEEPSAQKARHSTPVLRPEDAWKVTSVEADGVHAESAGGAARTFAPDAKVVEIPRQGFERLAQQAD